jgi:hypothetical protein
MSASCLSASRPVVGVYTPVIYFPILTITALPYIVTNPKSGDEYQLMAMKKKKGKTRSSGSVVLW